MNSNSTSEKVQQEISLYEIFQYSKTLIRYFLKNWKFVFLVTLIGVFIGFGYVLLNKPKYNATLTFVLEEEKSSSSGLSSAFGLASSLGLDIGNGSVGGVFSGANLIELMKSRTLIEKALLQSIKIGNDKITLADFYMSFSHQFKSTSTASSKDRLFPIDSDRSSFTFKQDSLLGVLYSQIIGKKGILSVFQKDKKLSIITVEVASNNELFSKFFAETLAKVVSDFYIETKSKKAKINFEILQKQTDSIRNELNAAIAGVAKANDNIFNLNSALNIARVPATKRQVDIQANTTILTQLVANLEMAKVSLRKETPLIQIIDNPILPLRVEKISKFKGISIGGLCGFILSLILLIVFNYLRIFNQKEMVS